MSAEMGPGIIGVGAGTGNVATGIVTTVTEIGVAGITTMIATTIATVTIVNLFHRRCV
jgi:hypothetical protein